MSNAEPGAPLANVVHTFLSEDILSGVLRPGAPLVQEQLAARYEVSRTPVRDALTQLTRDGLVKKSAGNGFVVNDLSTGDIADVLSVRLELESLALRQAFGHHTPRQLHQLRMLASEVRFADADNGREVFELSAAFHRQLLAPCTNAYLIEIIDSVWAHPVQRRILLSYEPGTAHSEKIAANHEAIAAALEAQQLDEALRLLADCHQPDDFSELK